MNESVISCRTHSDLPSLPLCDVVIHGGRMLPLLYSRERGAVAHFFRGRPIGRQLLEGGDDVG